MVDADLVDWPAMAKVSPEDKLTLAKELHAMARAIENCEFCQYKFNCGACPHLRWRKAREKFGLG